MSNASPPQQQAARKAIERFVREHGGRERDIRRVGLSYRWTSPDGRVAGIGWER